MNISEVEFKDYESLLKWELPIMNRRARFNANLRNTSSLNVALGLPGMFQVFPLGIADKLQEVAISFSSFSILCGVISLFMLWHFDKRHKVFRHELITYLVICNFIKTTILMIYPIVVRNNIERMGVPVFYNILGFFTAFAIEGADIAILVFAIHFALLIFKPEMKWKNKNTDNIEGGLYKFRYYIWPFSVVFPLTLASLAFIDYTVIYYRLLNQYTEIVYDNNRLDFPFQARKGGYKPTATMCSLPPTPIWYKLALSWGLRYMIVITILVTYICIYISISRQSSKIKIAMTQLGYVPRESIDLNTNRFTRKLKRSFQFFAQLVTPIIEREKDDSAMESDEATLANFENGDVQAGLHIHSLDEEPHPCNNTNNSKNEIHIQLQESPTTGGSIPTNFPKVEVDNLQRGLRKCP